MKTEDSGTMEKQKKGGVGSPVKSMRDMIADLLDAQVAPLLGLIENAAGGLSEAETQVVFKRLTDIEIQLAEMATQAEKDEKAKEDAESAMEEEREGWKYGVSAIREEITLLEMSAVAQGDPGGLKRVRSSALEWAIDALK